MSVFTTAEIEFLRTQPLARLATVGADGRPQVRPSRIVSWGIGGSSSEVSARDVALAG